MAKRPKVPRRRFAERMATMAAEAKGTRKRRELRKRARRFRQLAKLDESRQII